MYRSKFYRNIDFKVEVSMFENKVINKPKVINDESVDRWFLVDEPNKFFQKKEYALYYLANQFTQE